MPAFVPPPPAAEADSIISARALSKWYGQVIGLNNFNLEIKSGITGIVGPNGSGKSTFFKLITGMIKPSVGDLNVLDQVPWDNTKLRRNMGLCPDFDNLSDEMTGTRFLELVGGLHQMTGDPLKSRIKDVQEIVGMTHAMDRKIGGYSKGMRQRIKLAGTILHEPKMLLLDEPLAGTDPLARRDIINLIKKLHKDYGHDIVVSSHVLFEVERMTHDVALIYKGRAVASGDINEIRGLIDKHPHNIVVQGEGMSELAKRLLDKDFIVSVGYDETRKGIMLQVSKPDQFFDSIPGIVSEVGCNISQLYSLDDDLEAVFKYLVGW
jgi:ABC-2 type transport system ATP-binding protein